MASNNGTGTSIPGTGTSIPGTGTAIPGSGTGTAIPGNGTGTAIPSGTGTMAAGNGPVKGRVGTTADIPMLPEYVINGIRYKVDHNASASTLVHQSGEAKILVVENGGNKFALKLYIPNHGPDHNVLNKVQQAKGGFLIRLHDHGVWTDSSTGKKFDYEIMDYLVNGSLADVQLRNNETLFRNVAMRMAFAIRQSHQQGLIHRDIKPENFMFTDATRQNFVLIDFGIARATDGTNPVKVDAAKSSYFVSPEGAISSTDRTTYVGPPTDYYSMGMSLLALLYGEKNFYSMYPANDLGRLDLQKRNNSVVREARRNGLKISDSVADLLEALLEFSDANRAGFAEVERWYKGESIRKKNVDTANVQQFRVVFNETKNLVATSPEALAKMMLDDMEFAKKFLYRGLAKSALQGIRPTLAMEIEDITQTVYPRAEEQEAGVYAAALMLDPSIKYTAINGKQIDKIEDIADEIWENYATYALRLGKKTDRLWIYLQAHGDEKVKGLMAKYQPMISRNKEHGIYALVMEIKPNLNYYLNFKTGQKVVGFKLMAKELWNNSQQYVNELKNPDHSVYTWLKEHNYKDKDIKDLVNYINEGGVWGLYSLCKTLDLDFPLYDHNGNPMTTMDEVSEEFTSYYVYHPNELANSWHPLWTWLSLKSEKVQGIVTKYVDDIGKNNSEGIWQIYYRVGTNVKPFLIQWLDDKSWHYANNLDEIITALRDHGLTDDTIIKFSTPVFALWLSVNNNPDDNKLGLVLESMIQKEGKRNLLKAYEYIYRLRPDVAINFYTDKSSKMYVYSAKDIGEAINVELDPGVNTTRVVHTSVRTLIQMLYDPATFKKSQLYAYMKARKMDSYITAIEKVTDIPANIKAHPSAPYNEFNIMWKVISLLGAEPTFSFTSLNCKNSRDNGKVTTLKGISERSGVTLSEQSQYNIFAYIALFFHENVKSNFSFDKLKGYYEFIKKHFASSDVAKRGRQTEDDVMTAKEKRDKAWDSLTRIRKIALWICMPIMLVIIGWICYLIATDGASTVSAAIDSIGGYVKGILAIVGALLGLSGGLGGAIGGGIIGWLVGWLLVWLLSALAAYLLVILLLGAAIWCAWKLKSATTDTHIPNKAQYDQLVTQSDIYVVTKALGTFEAVFPNGTVNPGELFKKSADEAKTYKKQARKALIIMILITIVTIFIGGLIIEKTSKTETSENVTYQVGVPMADDLPGTWEGIFGKNNEAVMEITSINTFNGEITVTGSVVIKYSSPMTRKVEGTFNPNTGNLELHVYENGLLQNNITYSGKMEVDEDYIFYSGIYKNGNKGTSYDFSFSKKLFD